MPPVIAAMEITGGDVGFRNGHPETGVVRGTLCGVPLALQESVL